MGGPGTGLVEVTGLSKRFGEVQAVQSLSFTAQPGRVTGFLGPNGSGKTTTLAMVLGLVRADSGTATIGGVPYSELERPGLTVGASLSANFHPAHTGRAHLDIVRRGIGIPESVVADTLELVGMTDAADPFSPTRPWTDPGVRLSETPCNTSTPKNCFRTPVAVKMASVIVHSPPPSVRIAPTPARLP